MDVKEAFVFNRCCLKIETLKTESQEQWKKNSCLLALKQNSKKRFLSRVLSLSLFLSEGGERGEPLSFIIIIMTGGTNNHSSSGSSSALPRLPPSAAASADAAAAAGRALWGRLGAAAGGVRSLAAELAADVIETAEDLAKEVRREGD